MELSALQIAVLLLVYGMTQEAVAIALQEKPPKLNRVISGKLSVDTIKSKPKKAFADSHPVLDALMPHFAETLAAVRTDKKGAEQMARLLELALNAPSVSLQDQWLLQRQLGHFYMEAGSVYDKDTEKVIAYPVELDKAVASFRALPRLGKELQISSTNTLALGVDLNCLAADMIRAAADDGKTKDARDARDAAMKKVLGDYEHLLRRTRDQYGNSFRQEPPRPTATDVKPLRAKDTHPSFTPEQIVLRQIALFAGSAIAELSSLVGNDDRIVSVFDDLYPLFGRTKRGVIETVFLGLAWPHVREDIEAAFTKERGNRAA